MFHVEHTPIQEPPPFTGTAFDEAMDARIYGVHGQDRRERRHAGCVVAIDLLLEMAAAIRDAEPLRDAILAAHDTEHRKAFAASSDESPDLARPKRSAAAEDEDPF